MNIANVLFVQGSAAHANEQTVQPLSENMPFPTVFGQMVEQFLESNLSYEEMVSFVDVEQKLEAILPLLFGKTEEELVELLGEEIAQLIYPVLEQIEQFMKLNEIERDELSNFISMFFTPENSQVNTSMNQIEGNQPIHRDTITSFYRFLNLIEAIVTQQTQQKNYQTKQEQPIPLQKMENVITKIVDQLKTNLQNYHHNGNRNTGENKANHAKPVHSQQPFIPFQQMSMDRIQQFEWRIQLNGEMDGATFVKEFEKILLNSNLRTFKNGLTELQVRLHPEHLGRLSIKLIQQDGTLIARITTQTEAAKQLIESQLHQLRHALAAQNIQVEKIEIMTNSNVQEEQNHSDTEQREQHEHETNQNVHEEERSNEDEEQSFKEWLESLIF